MYRTENVLFPDESKSQEMKPKRNNAISRLMRDLKEWNKSRDEFPCIDACPLEDNIMEWHCNICPETGNYRDIIFHLILHFTDKYPNQAPEVFLCTTMPHPNVFGDWICLDMIKRYEQGRYKGWTAGYSVTSVLMQLQSFLFEEGSVAQMEGYTVQRSFNKKHFERNYLPQIKSFVCKKCNHCWDKPFPIPVSVTRRQKDGSFGKSAKSLRAMKYRKERKRQERLQMAQKAAAMSHVNHVNEMSIGMNETDMDSGDTKIDSDSRGSEGFAFWDGIYKDLETCIFAFFAIADLLKLRRVSTRFSSLVRESKMIQKESIKCWFHRVSVLPSKEIHFDKTGIRDDDMTMLLLGYGVSPVYFENMSTASKLENQIFGKRPELYSNILNSCGHFSIIQSINTTFDLLSSDAFENYGIKKSVFKDMEFTHFLPLYINPKHGKLAMKQMETYMMRIWGPCGSGKYHPWLALHAVANAMKSLIVSVMQVADSGAMSLHYSINVLEAFFRLHHTLLAIYFTHYDKIGALLQQQISLFFKDKNYRLKRFVPDYGIFLCYLTLWENPKKLTWNDIALELLDETFTRQVKWVLAEHPFILNGGKCSRQDRIAATWDTSQVSRRLFMFNYFFFKTCCGLGSNDVDLKTTFQNYNDNFGFPQDHTLAERLQLFVKKIQTQVTSYSAFFKTVEVKYPGMGGFSDWLYECMRESAARGYHKPWMYNSSAEPTMKLKANEKDVEALAVSIKKSNKPFKWGQQRMTAAMKVAKQTPQPNPQMQRMPAAMHRAQYPQRMQQQQRSQQMRQPMARQMAQQRGQQMQRSQQMMQGPGVPPQVGSTGAPRVQARGHTGAQRRNGISRESRPVGGAPAPRQQQRVSPQQTVQPNRRQMQPSGQRQAPPQGGQRGERVSHQPLSRVQQAPPRPVASQPARQQQPRPEMQRMERMQRQTPSSRSQQAVQRTGQRARGPARNPQVNNTQPIQTQSSQIQQISNVSNPQRRVEREQVPLQHKQATTQVTQARQVRQEVREMARTQELQVRQNASQPPAQTQVQQRRQIEQVPQQVPQVQHTQHVQAPSQIQAVTQQLQSQPQVQQQYQTYQTYQTYQPYQGHVGEMGQTNYHNYQNYTPVPMPTATPTHVPVGVPVQLQQQVQQMPQIIQVAQVAQAPQLQSMQHVQHVQHIQHIQHIQPIQHIHHIQMAQYGLQPMQCSVSNVNVNGTNSVANSIIGMNNVNNVNNVNSNNINTSINNMNNSVNHNINNNISNNMSNGNARRVPTKLPYTAFNINNATQVLYGANNSQIQVSVPNYYPIQTQIQTPTTVAQNTSVNGLITSNNINGTRMARSRGPPMANSNISTIMNGTALVTAGDSRILVKAAPHEMHNGLKPRKPPIARCFVSSDDYNDVDNKSKNISNNINNINNKNNVNNTNKTHNTKNSKNSKNTKNVNRRQRKRKRAHTNINNNNNNININNKNNTNKSKMLKKKQNKNKNENIKSEQNGSLNDNNTKRRRRRHRARKSDNRH